MIAMRKYFVKTSGNRQARTDLCKGQRPENADDPSYYPGSIKNKRRARFFRYDAGCFKNANANDQTHNDHREIESAEFGLNGHTFSRKIQITKNKSQIISNTKISIT